MTGARGSWSLRWGEQDVLLAIGGGSVIDTAKSIAAGTCYDGDVYGLYGKVPRYHWFV